MGLLYMHSILAPFYMEMHMQCMLLGVVCIKAPSHEIEPLTMPRCNEHGQFHVVQISC